MRRGFGEEGNHYRDAEEMKNSRSAAKREIDYIKIVEPSELGLNSDHR